MVEQLHRLQVIGLPTLVPRSPVPEREGLAQAVTAGGANGPQCYPDLPAPATVSPQWNEVRGHKSRINPQPPIDPLTGPPPAFEANVLEVQARGRRNSVVAAPEPAGPSQRQWQAPAMPEPALINLQF